MLPVWRISRKLVVEYKDERVVCVDPDPSRCYGVIRFCVGLVCHHPSRDSCVPEFLVE